MTIVVYNRIICKFETIKHMYAGEYIREANKDEVRFYYLKKLH